MAGGVIIVGAGHGGSQVGLSLRQEGYDGQIRLLAAEPDLPYHKPPLSKAFLKDPEQEPQILRAEKAYRDATIDLLMPAMVQAIDRDGKRILLADGNRLDYDQLVLATGAANRRLALPGHDLAGVFGLRTIEDAHGLRGAISSAGSVVIVGGGFIGLEVAATLVALGKRVTVLEMAPRILGRAVSAIVAEHVARLYGRSGIDIRTQVFLSAIEGSDGHVRHVRLADGEMIDADLVLVGIGAVAEDGLARAAGLDCDNGVVVDGDLRSSDPAIFAIGDVANFPQKQSGRRMRLESVQNATDQARHLAKVIAGKCPAAYGDLPWFWSDLGATKLQMAGLAFDVDRSLVIGETESGAFSVYHFSGGRLVAVDSVNRPGDHMLARKMIALGYAPTESELRGDPQALKARLSGLAPA